MASVDEVISVTVTALHQKPLSFLGPTSTMVEQLRQWTKEKCERNETNCTLIYLGQLLNDGQSLSQCSIRDNSFVRATFQTIPKPLASAPSPADLTARTPALIATFRTCLSLAEAATSSGSVSTPGLDFLFRALSDSLREVSRDLPSLAEDRAAFLMVQDSKLHRALLHRPQYITQAIKQHPVLLEALRKALDGVEATLRPNGGVAQAAPPVSARHPEPPGSSSAATPGRLAAAAAEGSMAVHYDMDYLMLGANEDEEEEEEDDEDEEMLERRSIQPASAPLTRDQLSAALTSALTSAVSSGAVPGPSDAENSSPGISAQALLAAMNLLPAASASAAPATTASTVAPSASVSSSSETNPWREKLEALAELGFTDETAGRRALEAANGDIEMAVDLLLG